MPGEKGTIDRIDDMGTLHMQWDSGRTLGVVLGEDEVEKVPLERETEWFTPSSVQYCDEQEAERHADIVQRAMEHIEGHAIDQDQAWVVRSTFLDRANEGRAPDHQFVEAGSLAELLEASDMKNGVDAGFSSKRNSIVMVAYGQNYQAPGYQDTLAQAFECKPLKPEVAKDFRERIDNGWEARGEAAQKLFLSPKDHASIKSSLQAIKELNIKEYPAKDPER